LPSKSDSILGHPWQTNFRGKLNIRRTLKAYHSTLIDDETQEQWEQRGRDALGKATKVLVAKRSKNKVAVQ
jgi:hypothetical protein